MKVLMQTDELTAGGLDRSSHIQSATWSCILKPKPEFKISQPCFQTSNYDKQHGLSGSLMRIYACYVQEY